MVIEMDIMQMISTVGFPIVAFLLLFWQSTCTIAKNTQALNELLIYIKK
jgi:hypothetical protein